MFVLPLKFGAVPRATKYFACRLAFLIRLRMARRHKLAKQSDAGALAGLSRDQKVTALRVASVPEPAFTSQVESDAPRTDATADRFRRVVRGIVAKAAGV